MRALGAMVVVVLALIACGCDETPPPYDERTPIGPANPATLYCTRLGFMTGDSDGGVSECRFSATEACEVWTFYEGRCGQSHSACVSKGGSLETVVADAGTWTRVYAVCRLPNGKRCAEAQLAAEGTCR